MAQRKLPELAITYVKYGTTLLCSWPLGPQASSLERKFNGVKWLFLCSILVSFQLPILYTAYLTRNDFMEVTKYICFAGSISHGIIKMIVCRCYQREYQELIAVMENYFARAIPREREVLNACVRKAAPVHVVVNVIGFIAAVSYVCGPLVLDQDLPTEAVYPFAIDYYPIFQIVYTIQSIVAFQCCAVGPLDGQVCMLFWFTIARLKLLADDMRNVASVDDLNACIRVHQSILRFNEKTINVARPIVTTTVAMATVSLAFGAIHLIGNEPLEVKAQFVGLDVGYGLELYLSAWAAENFMKAMDDVKWALYDSPWLQRSQRTNRSVVIVLQRLNKIPKVTVGGLIPELSLNYYAVYLSKTMSFFTTLRVMLQKMEDPL
ncbi:uncharacterized protein LOC107045791 [Diachasma alloeum]|uniref:Odorant receptor n=1 Tax=Diachasma alloeum TaxID=454923 RepID=A0A4E0RP85_9HYME|nr:uncharacterized protein LOC107045791 [Diachasma alloeum]THK33226.1 odorant receptor 60 [Diachasma alloeum]